MKSIAAVPPSPPDGRALPSLRWRPLAARPWRGVHRLVRTQAFRLAALYIAVFAVSVLGVLLFVYWMSADFVERQTEATLDAEITGLAEQYAQRGISGLIQIVAARSAGDSGDGMLYLVTNPQGRPLAGNIAGWPAGTEARSGSVSFDIAVERKGRSETHPARGALIVMPGDYRLLVGRDVSDGATFRDRIKMTLVWSGLFARRNGWWPATSRTGCRCAAAATNSTSSPPTSTACSTRSSG